MSDASLGWADAADYAAQVRDVVSRNGLPIIDVAERLDREPNPRALYQGHFSVQGYALVAGIILEELAGQGLLSN
ncbi:MAG: hypothetical protein ACRECI_07440 [Methyloceanibacter sp.]